jgi:FkbM family methyltransferase
MGIQKSLARLLLPRGVRNYLRSPTRTVHWAVGELKYQLGARTSCTIRPGFELKCHPLAFAQAYRAQVEDPEQVREFDSFLASCTPGMTLLDVGAHFGLFSLAALHYGGDTARAVAVDASPTAVRMMAIQSRLNQVSDRLTVLQACVCEHPGVQQMVSGGVLTAGYYVPPAADHPSRDRTTVEATTIDQIVERLGAVPTHVKIDVEGFEGGVLRGARQTLTSTPAPLLFLELHNEVIRGQGGDPGAILGLLSEYGYDIQGTDGAALTREAVLAWPLIRVVGRRRREAP